MDSRQQFEKRYPVPFNADWSDEYQRYIWNKKDNSLTAAIEHSKLWEAWQASRKSLVVELPCSYENDRGVMSYYKDEIEQSLSDAGVKSK